MPESPGAREPIAYRNLARTSGRLDPEAHSGEFPDTSTATSILGIPEARARVSPITLAQYQAFPEFNENGKRTELIRGIVFEKVSKSPLHSSIAKFLYDLLLALAPSGFFDAV